MNTLCRTLRRVFAGLQRNAQSAISCAMIGSFLLANFGYPVWEPVFSKGDVPFPCQFSRCGCQTREQCRRSCCCHTKQEKVAWAMARGIEPDQVAVLTPEEKSRFSIAATSGNNKTSSCCQTAAKPSCCSVPVEAEPTPETELRWVLSIAAQRCNGTGVDWMQAGFVAAPPPVVSLSLDQPAALAVGPFTAIYFSPVSEPLLRPV